MKATDLKESKERYLEEFGGRKEKGERHSYNVLSKKKNKRKI